MQNTIMINGVELTTAQIMTIHVALQGFATHLTYQEFPLGDDEHGKIMTRNYLANISTINKLLNTGRAKRPRLTKPLT